MNLSAIQSVIDTVPVLELVVLVGSRARGSHHAGSDWDIAVQWQDHLSFTEQLQYTERLRRQLTDRLSVAVNDIDLIDLPSAGLAMRAEVAENGVLLKGDGTLAWSHFLLKTWRELEMHYWNQQHAA